MGSFSSQRPAVPCLYRACSYGSRVNKYHRWRYMQDSVCCSAWSRGEFGWGCAALLVWIPFGHGEDYSRRAFCGHIPRTLSSSHNTTHTPYIYHQHTGIPEWRVTIYRSWNTALSTVHIMSTWRRGGKANLREDRTDREVWCDGQEMDERCQKRAASIRFTVVVPMIIQRSK